MFGNLREIAKIFLILSVYITNRILHVHLWIHERIKFVSTQGHVISSMPLTKRILFSQVLVANERQMVIAVSSHSFIKGENITAAPRKTLHDRGAPLLQVMTETSSGVTAREAEVRITNT